MKKLLTLTLILALALALTLGATAPNPEPPIPEPETTQFTLDEVPFIDWGEPRIAYSGFMIAINQYPLFSITLYDPNGYAYSNHDGENFLEGIIAGVPPETPVTNPTPAHNMRVVAFIDGVRSGLRVSRPISGELSWTYSTTSHSNDRRSVVSAIGQGRFVEIGDEEFPHNLTTLDLSGRGLTSNDIWQLRAMADLEELDLSGNQINDLRFLRGISTTAPSLVLDLRDNPITLAQINELKATAASNVVIEHNASPQHENPSDIAFVVLRFALDYTGFFIENNGTVREFSFERPHETRWLFDWQSGKRANETATQSGLLALLNDVSQFEIIAKFPESTIEYYNTLASEIDTKAEIKANEVLIVGMARFTETFAVRQGADNSEEMLFLNSTLSAALNNRPSLQNTDANAIRVHNWLKTVERYLSNSTYLTRENRAELCEVCNIEKSWRVTTFVSDGEIVERRAAKRNTQGGLLTPCKAHYTRISPQAAKQIMDSEEHILLDVRRQDEFDEGHIAGAVLLPYDEIATRAAAELPDKSATILIYCRSGRRSEIAARELIEMGYTNVFDFGGILDWSY